MADKQPKAKPVTNDFPPKAGPKSANGGRNKRRDVAAIGKSSDESGFYAGYQADRKAEARTAFIVQLDETVKQARLLLAELALEERAGVVAEYMVTVYYLMSKKSDRNIAAAFVEVKKETMDQLSEFGTVGFLHYATSRAFSALHGGYGIAKFGKEFNDVLAEIQQRDEQFRQQRHNKQLVNA
jgi:hypothetical protein